MQNRRQWMALLDFRIHVWAAASGLLLLCLTIAQACNVPVFRYALEHWRADPYRVTIFHQGPLSDAERALVADLTTQQDELLANLAVRTVDVDDTAQTEPPDQQLFQALQEPQFPTIVVQYPASLKINVPVWSQPLKKPNIVALANSPVRTELIKRLMDGETAVWLLLESGDEANDQQAADLLAAHLPILEKTLKLPELTEAPEDNLLTQTPLQIKFSVIRVPRTDSDNPLVQMLLHAESDLLEFNEPMVFPIFGRGRALLPLIGAGITPENVQSSAGFLVGACSCEVKELNPGFDLLITADWDLLVGDGGAPLPATQTGKPEIVAIPAGKSTVVAITTPTATSAPNSVSVNGNSALAPMLVGVAAILIVAALVISIRRK